MCLCLSLCEHAYCQSTITKAKGFLSSLNYDFSVGLGTRVSKKPFDVPKLGIQFGLDARKDIKTIGGKTDLYGLVGLHFVQNGGKKTNIINLLSMKEDDSFNYNELAIPIRFGVSYKIKSVRLFFDLGPFVGFRIGGSEYDGLENKSIDFGVGGSMGCRFKRTAVAFGINYGIPNVATYEDLKSNSGEKHDLNTFSGYFSLFWTLGNKHKD